MPKYPPWLAKICLTEPLDLSFKVGFNNCTVVRKYECPLSQKAQRRPWWSKSKIDYKLLGE